MTTNDYNLTNAAKALRHYHPAATREDTLIELLTDLRHFCDAQGWDFGAADQIAHSHYLDELEELKFEQDALN